VQLTGEYRSRTADARLAASARSALVDRPAAERLLALRDLCAQLSPLGDLDPDAAHDIKGWPGTTALLCDTNARATLTADRLASLGVPVETAGAAAEPALPAWIALTLRHATSRTARAEDFTTWASREHVPDPAWHWRLLRSITPHGRDIDLQQLATALTSRRGLHILRRAPDTCVIASTVHRAKGLEFDNVVLVDAMSWPTHDDPETAGRRLFVALSRARTRLTLAAGIDTRRWRLRTGPAGRSVWIRQPPSGRGVVGLLLEPPAARALGPAPVDLTQHVGQPVRWDRADDLTDVEGTSAPCWTAHVEDAVVARTGAWFGDLIQRLTFGPVGRQPPHLSGGWVQGLETVASPGPTRDGAAGFWLGARVAGALTLTWER
jgi:hypothetical protein